VVLTSLVKWITERGGGVGGVVGLRELGMYVVVVVVL
jgi:hypothetical protein